MTERTHSMRSGDILLDQPEQNKDAHRAPTSITHLPSELLLNIIYEIQAIHIARGEPLGWIGVTHVCRLWREVSLKACSLWSTVDMNGSDLRWPLEMITRSQSSPLSVNVDFNIAAEGSVNSETGTTSIFTVAQNLARIKNLSIQHGCNSEPLQSIFNGRTAPLLSTLSISLPITIAMSCYRGPGPRGETSRSTSDPSFVLCDNSLLAKQLRRLTLYACRVDWRASLLHGLTHLTLSELPREDAIPPREFLQALSDIPNLKFFTTDDTPIGNLSEDGMSTRPRDLEFMLPSLRQCIFQLPFRLATDILAWLALPSLNHLQVSIELWQEYGTEDVPGFRECLSMIASHSVAQGMLLKGLKIYMASSYWEDHDGFYMNFDQSRPTLELITFCDSPISTFLPSLIEFLPFNNLAKLEVVGYLIPSSVWIETFGIIPPLTTIIVYGNVGPLFEALVYGVEVSEDVSLRKPPMLFTMLSDIIIRENPDQLAQLFPSPILTNLKLRHDFDAPIQRLSVLEKKTHAVGSTVYRESLEKVVNTVVFSECDDQDFEEGF